MLDLIALMISFVEILRIMAEPLNAMRTIMVNRSQSVALIVALFQAVLA